jgi:hypothetical protein
MYKVANGARIPNMGEKDIRGTSDEGHPLDIKPQVAEVSKFLASIAKMLNAGNRVVFEGNGGYI